MLSLILTVLNERAALPQWFDSITGQTKLPDELVVVDGGSTDGTWEFLQEYKNAKLHIVLLQKKGNIAHGRNEAIAAVKGDVIAVTDAGCVHATNWLEDLVRPIELKSAQFSCTAFSPWLTKDDTLLLYLLAAVTTPAKREFKKNWLPSSRSVAFTKELWQRASGYPEWIPYCEDVLFDLKLQTLGYTPVYVREPLVSWRPRTSLAAFYRQLYNYTRSDGHGKLNLNRQLIRYTVYGGALLVLSLSCFSAATVVLISLAACGYMYKFWLRWFEFAKQKSFIFKCIGFVFLPFVVVLGDIAKMCGWPVGVWQRLQGKITYQKL